MRAVAIVGVSLALSAGPLWAQSNPGLVNPPASAPQIVPTYWEKGTWATPSTATGSAGPAFLTVPGTAPPSTGAGTGSGGGSTDAMANMLSTSYGQTAVTTANSIAVNPTSVAGIGQAESNSQNIPAANGSTSAMGPFQFTQGTFNQVSQQYALGFSPTDITNPQDQAVAAAYYTRDVAVAVQNATGQPATTTQAYGGYVFGPVPARRSPTRR
jgi:Transglycosylase SLT domain